MMIKPNPNCSDNFCLKQQEKFKNRVVEEPKSIIENQPEEQVTHEDNTWGRSNIFNNFLFCDFH